MSTTTELQALQARIAALEAQAVEIFDGVSITPEQALAKLHRKCKRQHQMGKILEQHVASQAKALKRAERLRQQVLDLAALVRDDDEWA